MTIVLMGISLLGQLLATLLSISLFKLFSFFIGIPIAFVLGFAYWVYFESHGGQTPGKSIMDIKVVMDSGEPCTTKAAVLRLLGVFIDSFGIFIPWMVGMAMILINDENKRIGDILANTIVVDA
jgi:uncharacterized RDD family membrane protein YckC